LKDLRPAPVSGEYTGVEINATTLDNLLSDDFIAKAPFWLNITPVLLLALTFGVLASFFSTPIENLIIGIVFLLIPIPISLGLYLKGFWLPLVVQEVTALIIIILSLVVNYATEGRQKRFIKDAFKHYLSPAVIEQLIQHPEQLKLGGERKVLSIFFSDLQGFTSISERLTPEELTTLLNEYLSAMTDIVHEERGTIDKYEGDAIIAFWNAPLNVPDHAVRVVRAALRCQKTLAELRPAFKERIGKEMFMRIGINTGPAVVGNMGSRSRFDYTMLGDAVNLAARLEGVNKQFDTYTMISQSTLELLENTFAVRELARVAVVGRKEPVTVYEPMFQEEYMTRKEVLETFVRGLYQFYEGRFAEALDVFNSIQNLDPPAAAYVKKCQTLIETPPGSWQGVWVMATK
jgi:adenylate cyclase